MKAKVWHLEPPEISQPGLYRALGFLSLEDGSWQYSLSRIAEKSQGGTDGHWVSQMSHTIREMLKNGTWALQSDMDLTISSVTRI